MESSQVSFYLRPMKNLKIPDLVHDELKVFSAVKKTNMGEVGGFAIMKYLSANGHKFSHKPIPKGVIEKISSKIKIKK